MAKYPFAPPLPMGINPITCTYNLEHRDEGYQTFDGIYADCFSGKVWCPICARRRYASELGDEPCPSCSKKASVNVAWIRRVCFDIKEAYLKQLVVEQERHQWASFEKKTYQERKWLEACTMHEQCKASLYRVSDALRFAFPVGPGSPIEGIAELQFRTTDYFQYDHCAFLLWTEYGDFVFDPTGPQFGPSWPVVTTLNKYLSRMGTLTSIEDLGTHKRKVEQVVS